MPTYQYTCTDCGEPVEAVQKFTDAPLTVCAACGGRLRKVFSPVGIVFKGSGFYRTDSRSSGKTSTGSSSSTSSGDASSTSSGSSSTSGSTSGSASTSSSSSSSTSSGGSSSTAGSAA